MNDKTLVIFNPLLEKVKNRELHEYDSNSDVIEVCYIDIWFILNIQILSWSCTIPLVKDGITYEAIRFTEWFESIQKYLECAFGIKGRFEILRHSARLQSIENCD